MAAELRTTHRMTAGNRDLATRRAAGGDRRTVLRDHHRPRRRPRRTRRGRRDPGRLQHRIRVRHRLAQRRAQAQGRNQPCTWTGEPLPWLAPAGLAADRTRRCLSTSGAVPSSGCRPWPARCGSVTCAPRPLAHDDSCQPHSPSPHDAYCQARSHTARRLAVNRPFSTQPPAHAHAASHRTRDFSGLENDCVLDRFSDFRPSENPSVY